MRCEMQTPSLYQLRMGGLSEYRQAGFSLLETMFSVAITGLLLTIGLAAYVMCLHVSEQLSLKTFQIDDTWTAYHAINKDIHEATSYTFQGGTIYIQQGTATTLTYLLSPDQMMYRSKNGNGVAIVSTNVNRVQYQVMPRTGVDMDVYYGNETSTLNSRFFLVFALGHVE